MIQQKSFTHYIPALYIALFIELIYFAFTRAFFSIIAIFLIAAISIILRLSHITYQRRSSIWVRFRYFLYRVLEDQDIFQPVEAEEGFEADSALIEQIEETTQIIIPPSPSFIEELREIGINGILLLTFIMKQSPKLTPVKVLEKELKIPLVTVYRILKRMTGTNLVSLNYAIDAPTKSYYSILPEGESILVKLFEMLGGLDLKYLK